MARPVALPSSSLRARKVPKGVVISAPLLSVALSPLSSRLRLLSLTTHPESKTSNESSAIRLTSRRNGLDFIFRTSSSLVRCDDGTVEAGTAVGDPRDSDRAMAVNADLTEQCLGSRDLRHAGDRVGAQIILHLRERRS